MAKVVRTGSLLLEVKIHVFIKWLTCLYGSILSIHRPTSSTKTCINRSSSGELIDGRDSLGGVRVCSELLYELCELWASVWLEKVDSVVDEECRWLMSRTWSAVRWVGPVYASAPPGGREWEVGNGWWARIGVPIMLAENSNWGSFFTSSASTGSRFKAAYRFKPPLYSEAISRDSSRKLTLYSWVGGVMGGVLTWVSMKFNLTPRLHCLFDFRQLTQSGRPSSHFKCRSLQVRQPVRTLFGRDAATLVSTGAVVATGSVAIGFSPVHFLPLSEIFEIWGSAFSRFLDPEKAPCRRTVFWCMVWCWIWSPSSVASEAVEEEYGESSWCGTLIYVRSNTDGWK